MRKQMCENRFRQAGTEVEVTPEMVEVGAEYLVESGYLGAHDERVTQSVRFLVKGLLEEALSQEPFVRIDASHV